MLAFDTQALSSNERGNTEHNYNWHDYGSRSYDNFKVLAHHVRCYLDVPDTRFALVLTGESRIVGKYGHVCSFWPVPAPLFPARHKAIRPRLVLHSKHARLWSGSTYISSPARLRLSLSFLPTFVSSVWIRILSFSIRFMRYLDQQTTQIEYSVITKRLLVVHS